MRMILLIIPSMLNSAKTMHHKATYHITKEVYNKLNDTIPILKTIASKVKRTNEFNNALHFNTNDFQDIKDLVSVTGEISKNYLNVHFSIIKNLDQLNNFKQEIVSLNNISANFINIVIALINDIFKSIPEEDVEISNKSSNFLMNWFKKDNQNLITISVTHKYSTEISFDCDLTEDSNNITSKPNEAGEEEESKLLDKTRK